MTKDTTSKILLVRESDDELIDSFAVNWPILDTAVGARMVAAGVTPPAVELYDGLIVSEAVSGKSWIARADGSGGFTKQWLTYPWTIVASITNLSIGTGITHQLYTGLVFQASQNVNSSAADVQAGRIVVPIAGIYEMEMTILFPGVPFAAQYKAAGISLNGSVVGAEIIKSEDIQPNSVTGNSTATNSAMIRKLAAGTNICLTAWQNSGGIQQVDVAMRVSLLSPL